MMANLFANDSVNLCGGRSRRNFQLKLYATFEVTFFIARVLVRDGERMGGGGEVLGVPFTRIERGVISFASSKGYIR